LHRTLLLLAFKVFLRKLAPRLNQGQEVRMLGPRDLAQLLFQFEPLLFFDLLNRFKEKLLNVTALV